MFEDHFGNKIDFFEKQADFLIFYAYRRGYRVTDDGRLIGLRGCVLKASGGRMPYPGFMFRFGVKRHFLSTHRLAAYCFYGFQAFQTGLLVRHLNGDRKNFSRSNIAMGTYSDNQMDIPREVRVAKSKKARAAQGLSGGAAKLSRDAILRIRSFYKELPGKRAGNGKVAAICQEYGVSRRTLLNVAKRLVYAHVD